jgi:hypothetical protein
MRLHIGKTQLGKPQLGKTQPATLHFEALEMILDDWRVLMTHRHRGAGLGLAPLQREWGRLVMPSPFYTPRAITVESFSKRLDAFYSPASRSGAR